MKANLSPSIRSRLVLLVVTCFGPAAFMAVLLIFYDYHRAREELVRNSVMTARAMASVLDKEFAIVESTLQTLATSPNLSKNDLSAFYDQANNVLRGQSVINIVLGDADGKQLINTLRPFGAPLPQQNKIAHVMAVNQTGQPVISNLFIGTVSKRPVVAIAVPVRRGNDIVYTLSSRISSARFSKLLEQQNLPPNWIAAILDKNGTFVARTHEMAQFVGKSSAPSLMSRIATVQEDAFEGTTVEGIPVLAVFSRAPSSEWTVAIGIPLKELSVDLNRRFIWLIAATLILLGGSFLVAWMIGGRIARSVRELAVPALALGAGKAVEFKSFNLRETDEVGMALARASEMLLEAQYKANHDVLTGLANRALLKEILDQRLTLCQRNSTCLSVLYIDLDGFKKINDEHGHATGDKLLQSVSQRFSSQLRKSDITARLGGDEFAIVLSDTPVTEAARVAAKLIDCLRIPRKLDTCSAANWTVIPAQTGHVFHAKLDTCSTSNWTPWA